MSAQFSRRSLFGLSQAREPSSAAALTARVSDACLAGRGVACSACADPCEPRALRLRPLVGGRARVLIDAALCTGCGACLGVCPVAALSLVSAALPESSSCA